ncbi:MAG: PLDc N-terminal domain-containing protein [Bacillota bacterium]
MVINLNSSLLPEALAIGIIGLASTVFWIWVLVTCVLEEHPGKVKAVWVVLIALTHWVGALAYLSWKSLQKRTHRKRQE